jgi:hypothetical protein
VRASGHGDHFGGCRGVRFGELYGEISGFHGFEKLELLREFHLIMPCHCTAQRKEIAKRYLGIRGCQVVGG